MEFGGLLGIFLGGALPWLEAVIVVPAGIIAGLDPVAVVLAGLSGNLLTVALAAFFGEQLRSWWVARRGHDVPDDAGSGDEPRRSARRERTERVMRRWGMPGLTLLGPIGLGTQLSALLAVSMGVSARRTMLWIGAGTAAWTVLAAVLAVTGLSVAGICS